MLSDKHRQLFGIRVQLQRGNFFNGELGFDKAKLRGVVGIVHDILRFHEQGKHQYDTKQTNGDKERGL